ncbi:acyl-CoA dehydrogenase family protein [Acuticoccus sp. MNP-M23]|uniref:acyl-CoA dehydrogenase family protein n=1 Tax=Acuticoccus sp. MNP-M23 TaxID=3072793 RepID=UPI002815630E|nr:acyl-CoA dehydrogenase family protein [Acuticoccus sp. MNP-M23]WMS42622.1 acyl-CoA dehydrogenase family protein [Acuticoccus sp. MNP-M23]
MSTADPRAETLSWPFFEPAHRAFAEKISAFAEGEALALTDHHDVDGSCRKLVTALGKAGLLGVTVPQDAPLDVRTLCLARETLAAKSGLADFAFAMQGLGAGPIGLAGTDEQKARYLPKVAAGEWIAAFALTEPKSGSDVAAIETAARIEGDEVVIDGEKTWISNGGIADFYVVFARTGEGAGARGLSAFIVDADTPGLTIAERLEVIAPHPLARLKFSNCRIPLANRLGEPGRGFGLAMATLDIFRSTVGAAALGFARAALEATLTRAHGRHLFGAPMGELPLAQAGIAEMALGVDAAALLVYRAAWTKDMGAPRVTREASMAKLFATETAQKVIDTAVQLHGGDGVRSGTKVEELYREIRALRIYEGASEVQKIVIARAALAASLPAAPATKAAE